MGLLVGIKKGISALGSLFMIAITMSMAIKDVFSAF